MEIKKTQDKIDPKIKHEAEYLAMTRITKNILYGTWILDLWLEFEEKLTPRARLATQLDKIDAAVMALRYESMGYDVSEFYPYTRQRLQDPYLLQVFDILMQREDSLEKSHSFYFKQLRAGRDLCGKHQLIE